MEMDEPVETRLAREIAARVVGEPASAIWPITGMGSVNAIYLVDIGHSHVVVRMRPAIQALSEYHKEEWCLQRAADAGIPGPTVMDVGQEGETAYMVETLVPGLHGEAATNDTPFLWRRIGEYARRIHRIPVRGFGNRLAGAKNGVFDASGAGSWPDFINDNVESLRPSDDLCRLRVYSSDEIPTLQETFASLRRLDSRTGLNHGDLSLRNVILGPEREVYLLDWGCAEVHLVPHHDLAELLLWHTADSPVMQAFVEGYGLSAAAYNAIVAGIGRFQLLKIFDLVRWALDQSPPDVPHYVTRAREMMSKVLAGAG